MDTTRSRVLLAVGVTAAITLAGCADMSRSDRATAKGAAIGGVAGAVLTESPAGAAVGAVVGGVIGHEVDEGKKK